MAVGDGQWVFPQPQFTATRRFGEDQTMIELKNGLKLAVVHTGERLMRKDSW